MTIAGWSGPGPVLQAVARQAAACAGLAGLTLIGGPAVTAAASATAPAAAAQQTAGPVATGRAVRRPVPPGGAVPGPVGSARPASTAAVPPSPPGPPASPAPAPAGSSGHAPQLAAGAQFVNSPRAVPASAGATQVCPVPSRPGQMTCMALVPSRARATADAGPPAGAYAPADLLSAYGLASAAASVPGGTATVAIVDAFNDRRAAHDLAVYRAHYGLPRCTVSGAARCLRIVNASGGSRLPRTDRSGDWEFEESVDLDMVSAICPLCHILLVEATSDSISSLAAAEGYASRHASVVSNSWGSGAEFTGENAFDGRFNHPGVAIVAAAGDAGYGTQYPAASQFVTAVGGTTLIGATPASSGSQLAWSGTGSGCSSLEPKPAWQQDATPSACQNRTDTDVAADADPHTPVAIYDSAGSTVPGIATGWNAAGGTSVATPIIAAVYVLAGGPAAGTYPASYPYLHPGAFTDVTSGSNGRCEAARRYLCTARAGYDGPTGLGTPSGPVGFAGTAGAVSVIDPGTQDLAVGQRIRLRIAAAGGRGLAFAVRGLPAGLSFGRADGVISGRPAAAGTFRVGVSATGAGSARGSVKFAIIVVRRMTDHFPAAGPVRLDGGRTCLVTSGARGLGARAEIGRCAARGARDWRFVPAGSPGGAGLLKIHGGCLGRAGRGTGLVLRACTGSLRQRWQYRTRDRLYNPASGQCLTDPARSMTSGTRVFIRSCGTSTAQSWELPAGPVLSGVAGRCLTDPADRGTPGTRLAISPCRRTGGQRWTPNRNGTLRIRGECLAVAGRGAPDGAAIVLARCSGAASQKWFPAPDGELLNGGSGRCLADPGNTRAAGTRLVQQDCYGQPGELWAVS